MTKSIHNALFGLILLTGSSVLMALPPNTEEPDTNTSYAMCAAVAEVHLLFIERDLPLYDEFSVSYDTLKVNRRAYRKELKRFEKKLAKMTSSQQAGALIQEEKMEVLGALKTQQVEDDIVATDNLRKAMLDVWYTDFCDSKA